MPEPPSDAIAVRRADSVAAAPSRPHALRPPKAVSRVPPSTLALLAPLALGLLAWGLSLHTLIHVPLGVREVPSILPAFWWLSLAALLTGAVIASCSPGPRGWIVAAYVASLALVLYGTIPAIAEAPQYAWTYKHIGVVRLIELRGAVSPSVDIYNRWPGFFSAAAALSQLMGLPNPVSFAAWSELLFALVDALLVAALAWSVLRDAGIAALATVLFTTGNWVGQGYFSPQATVFPLALATLLLTMRSFTSGSVGGRTIRMVELVVRRPQQAGPARVPASAGTPAPAASRARLAVGGAVILVLDAAIVASHQLTPYVLLLQLAGLAVVGVLRPRWILYAMSAITIGYLVPNLGFVNAHYGLFTSLDPFANAQAAATTPRPTTEPWIDQHAGQLLALLFLAGAAISALLLARRGLGRRALPLIALAATPVGLLLGQGYGGEASLRTFLFSAPWGAMLIAWTIMTFTGPRSRPFVALGVGALVAGLFVPAYFAQAWINVIPGGEVAGSEYFYRHAPDGAALITAAPGFPTRVGARYAVTGGGAESNTSPSLLIEGHLAGRPLGPQTIPAVVTLLRGSSSNPFLVFSTTGSRSAAVDALAPSGALASLRRAIRASSLFELWYARPDAYIYRLLEPKIPASSSRAAALLAAQDAAEDAAPHNEQQDLEQTVFGSLPPNTIDN